MTSLTETGGIVVCDWQSFRNQVKNTCRAIRQKGAVTCRSGKH